MCGYDDPSPSAVVRDALDSKEASKSDPEGVSYLSHLWELVEPLAHDMKVVLRTNDRDFPFIPVGAHWRFQPAGIRRYPQSDLVFDLPDDVCRLVQSHHATRTYRRLFGATRPIELPDAIRPADSRDDARNRVFNDYEGAEVSFIAPDDWATLRVALEASAGDEAGLLGGQTIQVCGVDTYHYQNVVRARIRGDRIELNISGSVESSIIWHWQHDFRAAMGFKE